MGTQRITPARKIALMIGVNSSPASGQPELRFAEESARRLAELLARPACGFELHGGGPLLGAQATTEAVRTALLDLADELGPDDLLLVSFTGHGVWQTIEADRRDVYLVTANFSPRHVARDENAHLSMRWLQDRLLTGDKPGQLLLLLDCCYAGALSAAQPDHYLDDLRQRLAQYLNTPATTRHTGAAMRKTIAATGPLHPTFERDDLTLFGAALLRGLDGAACEPDGTITPASLYGFLRSELHEITPGEYGFDRTRRVVLARYPERARSVGLPHQPWVMPHGQNPLFLGRVEELERLAELLTGDDPARVALMPALAGMGGIGKTQLAITFAHQFRARFPGGVFWLSMENPETVAPQVAACGGPAGLRLFDDAPADSRGGLRRLAGQEEREAERLTLEQRVARVRSAWEQFDRRLLIFDNLEDPALLEEWRPHGGGSRVLLTTRSERWSAHSGVQALPLRELADPDSLTLLLRPRAFAQGRGVEMLLAEPGAQAAAEALVRELGGLPLALALAGHYLAEHRLSLADYLQAIRRESVQHRSLNAELRQGLPTGHAASIVATFALSAARLQPDDPTDQQARQIWLGAAQLVPEPIAPELLLRLAGLNPADETQCEQGEVALLRLCEVGLLETAREGQADRYRLHRLLSAYARSISDDPARDRSRAEVAMVAEIQRLEDDGRLSEAPVLYGEHLRALTAGLNGREDADAAALWHELGELHHEQESYQLAREAYERALRIRRQVLPMPHPDTADTLRELGKVAYQENDYTQAHIYHTEALSIYEQTVGRVHQFTAMTLYALGNVAFKEENYAQARAYYAEALSIYEQTVGRVHCHIAGASLSLGRVAYQERDLVQARDYYTKAFSVYEQVVGRIHRYTADTLHELGRVALEEGDYAQARAYLTEALAIKEQTLVRVHRSTAVTLYLLGLVAVDEGNPTEAQRHFSETLTIKEQVLGPAHPDTMLTRKQLERLAQGADAESPLP